MGVGPALNLRCGDGWAVGFSGSRCQSVRGRGCVERHWPRDNGGIVDSLDAGSSGVKAQPASCDAGDDGWRFRLSRPPMSVFRSCRPEGDTPGLVSLSAISAAWRFCVSRVPNGVSTPTMLK